MAYEKNNGRPNRKGRKKVCSFCVDKVESIDYKEITNPTRKPSEMERASCRE
jgi:small subunit ribosomal protein S18